MRIFLIALLVFKYLKASQTVEDEKNQDVINLSVVACGDRGPETLNLLKSALMFTKTFLQFFIITEPNLKPLFIDQFKKWPPFIQQKFNFTLIEPKFPTENSAEWRKLFKLCASQRIFLPEILKSVDSLIYVDTDVLFISSLEELWENFKLFNESQIAALTPEHEDPNMGWYNRFARHPYYGELGLNSGVMLMNLTRMRSFGFVKKILPLYNKYKYNITWGDQCLLNILFHYHPDKLYVYDCKWNYRPDHCMYGSNCKAAQTEGAKVLHGCRRVFHEEKEPSFKAIYKIFDEYNFEEENRKKFFKELKNLFIEKKIEDTYCGKAKDDYFKSIRVNLIKHRNLFNESKQKYDAKKLEL